MPGLSKRSLGTELTALVRRAPIDVIRIYWPGKKYNRSAMENATSLQCKLLREREKRRRRKNNGKQWKKQWEAWESNGCNRNGPCTAPTESLARQYNRKFHYWRSTQPFPPPRRTNPISS